MIYQQYVDGKSRYDGVQSFLESRSIKLSLGNLDDEPGSEAICALGNLKNKLFNELDLTAPDLKENTFHVKESQFFRAIRKYLMR